MDAVPKAQWNLPARDIISILESSNLSNICYATVGSVVLLKAYNAIHKDYQSFLALGPGGTPSTVMGYLKICYLRLFALSDPFQPPSLSQACFPLNGYIQGLPRRSAPRPKTGGIAPHRQLNQKSTPELDQVFRTALHAIADAHPNLMRKGNSCFEKRGLALFLSACTASPHRFWSHLNPTCADSGEICHLHAMDGSMHLTLHPLDAAMVIASGWGERHPLAGRNIPPLHVPPYPHGKRLLPSGFVMVYTPQTEADIATLMEIVRAAAWWVGGVDLSGKGRGQFVGAVKERDVLLVDGAMEGKEVCEGV